MKNFGCLADLVLMQLLGSRLGGWSYVNTHKAAIKALKYGEPLKMQKNGEQILLFCFIFTAAKWPP